MNRGLRVSFSIGYPTTLGHLAQPKDIDMSHFSPADLSPNLTILRNKSWMGKRFFIDELGQLQKQANGIFTDGICKAHAAHSAKELMRIITALKPTDALCLGIPAAGDGTHCV